MRDREKSATVQGPFLESLAPSNVSCSIHTHTHTHTHTLTLTHSLTLLELACMGSVTRTFRRNINYMLTLGTGCWERRWWALREGRAAGQGTG